MNTERHRYKFINNNQLEQIINFISEYKADNNLCSSVLIRGLISVHRGKAHG